MKKLLLGLTLLVSSSLFASECTVSISKGANFPNFVDKHVGFGELVDAQKQKIIDRGYTLVDGIEAGKEIKVGLVTELNGVEGYWTLHRADAYTLNEDSSVGDIDVSSTPAWFIGTEPGVLIEETLEKAINALPGC